MASIYALSLLLLLVVLLLIVIYNDSLTLQQIAVRVGMTGCTLFAGKGNSSKAVFCCHQLDTIDDCFWAVILTCKQPAACHTAVLELPAKSAQQQSSTVVAANSEAGAEAQASSEDEAGDAATAQSKPPNQLPLLQVVAARYKLSPRRCATRFRSAAGHLHIAASTPMQFYWSGIAIPFRHPTLCVMMACFQENQYQCASCCLLLPQTT